MSTQAVSETEGCGCPEGASPPKRANKPLEVLAVLLSVLVVNQVARGGESNWLEGDQAISFCRST